MSSETRDISARRAGLTAEQRARLAERLRGAAGSSHAQAPAAIALRPQRDRAALSFAQQRQWFLWQLDRASTAYHVSGGLGFAGNLDVEALRAGVEALVARHESLRTIFEEGNDGVVRQVIEPAGRIELPCIDLSHLSAAERESRIESEVQRICARTFDLTRGPLLRAVLLKSGPQAHRLVVVMHHIISDGWSIQLILDELATLYRAHVLGQSPELPELAIQYADYAVWQRQWLEDGEGERQLAWWREQLRGDQPVLALSTDHPRNAEGRYSAAQHHFKLDANLLDGLKRQAQSQGATLFMVLLAAFGVLLFRHSGQADLRVGVPIANRNRVETAGVVGFFVNTQVLPAYVDGRMSLAQLLVQSRDAAIGAQSHQDLPFEQLVEALRPDRSLGVSPLFQVMFNHLRQDHRSLAQWPSLSVERMTFEERAAQFDLTLQTFENENGEVEAHFNYAAELFDPQTMARMATHYLAVLRALVENPLQTVADVELLGEKERAQLLTWGENKRPVDSVTAVHRLFEAQAKAQPQATAVIFGEESLSYAELNAQANRLAHRLIVLGVKPESRVGIAMERSPQMVVALLGILKAGGAYVPLDPAYPQERLAYMVADSGIELLLTHSALGGRIPGSQGFSVLELDRLQLQGEPAHDPQVAVHADNLAYVIYTSGSTGKPKGVEVLHRAIVRLVGNADYARLDSSVRMLQFAPLAFDASTFEIWGSLCNGGVLVQAPAARPSFDELAEVIEREHVTTAWLTAALFNQMLESHPQALGGLRQLLSGGEAMSAHHARQALERFGQAELVNGYGPTECTTFAVCQAVRASDVQRESVPLGGPIVGTACHVLDASLHPVPQGVVGELYLGGAGLARGYLKQAGLTAERFVATEGGQRLYRTGDLVRWNAEGQLEYLGRIDHQVKVRGFRIELGEIEAQLLAQENVREAVVVANQGPAGARLVGYVSGQDIDTAVLRARLAEALPDYMVPGAIVVLDALPLNANGKVDRKALPDAEFGSAQEYEAPQGEVEEALSQIWSQVLGVERVGRNDNFFELGGHSLLALKLLERMRAQGWSVQVRTLFQQPQLAAFAQAVVQSQGRREVVVPVNGIPEGCQAIAPSMLTLVELDAAQIGRIEAAIPGGAANIQDIYPLAPLQEGILFHHLLEAGADAYITRHLLSFDSRQRLERFVDSFNQVIARHDILRTAVLWEGLKEPVQVVQRHAELKLQWLDDEAGDTTTDTAQRLDAHVGAAHYRIDVRQAPMIRAVAAHDAAQGRWLLQVPSHHMVLDHTTLELIIEEIALIQQGAHRELPEPIPFRRFVAQARLGVSQAEHEAFFGKMLGDVDEPTAPFNLLDVQGDGRRVAEARLMLEAGLSSRVRQQAQRHGVSAATLFHLAWALVLARTTGRDDVVFGTVLFGRMQGGEGADRALGLFINTLPVRIRLGRQSVAQCVKQAHVALTDLLHHEHASLSLAQRCSGLPGGTPLFSSLLNYRYSPKAENGNDALAWDGMEVLKGEEQTNYPVGMSVDDLGEDFALVAHVSGAVDAQRVCEYLHAAIKGIADGLARQPERMASELDLLSLEEKSWLSQCGDNREVHGDAQPVHRQIEAHAKRQPHATALLFGDEVLSYDELNRRANRLAHRLIALGVKPESLVGIAVERSVEMMVGILAILKAGGAYVPLDPEYPAERLGYMVADSGIALLLTQSHLRNLVPGTQSLQVLELDTLDTRSEPEHDPQVALHGESLAYVIYTSGSTGKPKGAAIRHDALYSCMAWMQQTYRLTQEDTVLHKAPFGFDVSCWEMFWPLTSGVRLVIANPGDHRDPERLVQLIQRHQITTLNFVPSMLQAFLAHEGIEASTRLKHIIVGGEAMPAETQREALRRLSGATLQNLYGPTETTIHVTRWTCRDDGQSQVPIGQPISQTQALVLDGSLNPVPQGVAGELYLGGISLARGYLKRAGLTAERFVATEGGQRLYRTGDLVRWNAEGQLEYLGRIDHQVKVRGFRIELGEIEAQLLAQENVREAVVVANQGPAGARLVGYVSGQDIDTAVLRARLAEALPDYMVPGAIVVLDALPLNANGKVDRKALPDAEFGSAQEYEAPQGEVEEALSQIWSQVLGVERVGRNDNFFELGGHSLLALKLLERMRAQGWSVQVRTLFQQPQLAAFAQAVVQSQGRREVVVPVNGIPEGCQAIAPSMLTLVELDAAQIGRIEAAIPGGAANIQDIYPLAPLQEGILFHHLLEAGADAYITRHLLSFDSRQRLERFVDSFNQVIARHDILRTAVLWEGLKEPVQVVQRHAELKLQWLDDEAGDTTTDTAQRLDAHVGAAHYRIDVRQAPMIRAVAAHDAAQGRWLLQVPSHHMVLDHTTLELIIEEIALIQQGAHRELPEPIPFRRFVAQARLGVSQAEHEAFFGKMLGDVDEPTAPFNLLDVQGDGRRVAEARLMLEAGLSSRVRQQAQRHGVSAATLFHLAWALVLARTTGRDDVVFGTVLFGRMQGGEGADRALGLFINTLPVRIRLGRQSVAQCVKQAHVALTDLLHHEHASLSLAQRCSGLPGGTPLFSSLLNYRYSAAEASRTWEGMEPLKGEERTSYPVTMSIDDMGESFRLVAQIMDDVDARRICDCMHRVVEGLVEALGTKSDQLASGLQVLTEDEIHQLDQWGERTLHSEDATPVHHLIERQAQQRPQAIALAFDDELLSYGDLNHRANRLAHRLIALGVKPETLVGIALERSIDMVVGLLAVLKAGGAYVPLDPQYPVDRLAYMVEDSGIRLLLTQSHIGGQVPHGDALTVLALDTLDLGAEPETNPALAVHGDNLAYVIYTSGSTGKPKGAQLCHRNVARLLDATRGWFEFGSQDVWTMFHSYAFDFSVWEIFGALCTGGKLVIVPFWVSRSPEDFLALLRDQRVTVLNQTPSAFGQLVALPQAYERELSLRVVIFGGEALDPQRLRPWIAHYGDDSPQLINMYGITETTVHVTYRRITAADLAQQRSPMGIGIPDLGLRVLDSALEATPIGVAGELFVSGAGLSRGYLKRAALTAERFVATEGGQRLYRTGDLVRWNAEGQLEYLGRIDHQVKVRGFRIELGEIEAQLLAQPEVREAIVIANEGPAGTRLVAYVSPQAEHVIEVAMLKDALGRVLPDYMVPAAVVVLDALPLNANGKVDRKALPDAEFGSAQAYEAPQGGVEEALSQIWSQVLGVERVGRNDNFFELGGHSLMCVQMIARVQAAMHTTLTIKDVFQHPTVAGMAGLLASAGSAKPAPEALSEIDAFLDSLEETA